MSGNNSNILPTVLGNLPTEIKIIVLTYMPISDHPAFFVAQFPEAHGRDIHNGFTMPRASTPEQTALCRMATNSVIPAVSEAPVGPAAGIRNLPVEILNLVGDHLDAVSKLHFGEATWHLHMHRYRQRR
jgi:hypothetical protein